MRLDAAGLKLAWHGPMRLGAAGLGRRSLGLLRPSPQTWVLACWASGLGLRGLAPLGLAPHDMAFGAVASEPASRGFSLLGWRTGALVGELGS